jgi:hypothetical protein
MTNIRIQKFFLLLVTDILYLTNKETAKDDPDIKFLPKHFTEKNIHIDTIAPNNTNFTVVFLRYLRLCFSWMTPRKKFNCRGKLLHNL